MWCICKLDSTFCQLTEEKAICLLPNQHQALKSMHPRFLSSMDGGRNEEETREGGEEERGGNASGGSVTE